MRQMHFCPEQSHKPRRDSRLMKREIFRLADIAISKRWIHGEAKRYPCFSATSPGRLNSDRSLKSLLQRHSMAKQRRWRINQKLATMDVKGGMFCDAMVAQHRAVAAVPARSTIGSDRSWTINISC